MAELAIVLMVVAVVLVLWTDLIDLFRGRRNRQ